MTAATDRIYYLDALRAILMCLGVVIHSAQIFNPETTWWIESTHSHVAFSWLVSFLSFFRMPAFFLISGYFFYLTVHKYPPLKFIRVRFVRILVPFIATAFTVNALQSWFYYGDASRLLEPEYYLKGGYIYHLWFLVNILAYFAIFFVVYHAYKILWSHSGWHQLSESWLPYALLLFSPFLLIVSYAINKLGFDIYRKYMGMMSLYQLTLYMPYFLVGILFARYPGFFGRCMSVRMSNYLMTFSLLFFIRWFVQDKQGTFFLMAYEYVSVFTVINFVVIGLILAQQYLSGYTRWAAGLSDASYSIYLFHHILVIIFGYYLTQVADTGGWSFFLIVSSVLALTYLMHIGIVRNSIFLSYLFNGKRIVQTK